MLVYGDRKDVANPRQVLDAIGASLAKAADLPPGIARHGELVSALITAGRLQQGIEDAGSADKHGKGGSVQALGHLTYQVGQAVFASWKSGFRDMSPLPVVPTAIELPPSIAMTVPEGYAFYALYPEAYAEAALRVRLLGPPRVIGIRSIGTSLGAVVAAALGAPPPITVRPTGHPFDRHLSPGSVAVAPSPNEHYLIVDEGPGMSASSFGAVIGWLEAAGIPAERITLLPSHDGLPGPQATTVNRERWTRVDKVVADLGDNLPPHLAGWVEALLGPLDAPLREISGGGWRHERGIWPPVNSHWERRKFLASVRGSHWLIKFAGLGGEGEAKLAIARHLHAAGLGPEPRGIAHGFLIERWRDEARHLADNEAPIDAVADYIGARSHLAPSSAGATIAELLIMAKRNVTLALGEDDAAALDSGEARADDLQARVRPVRTDNRMDRHEWLVLPDGQLLKTDGLDHHAGHDLIGCQDLAWDVAGAIDAFDLDAAAKGRLIASVERRSGRHVDRELLAFYHIAYAAFRLGQAQLSADMLVHDPEERTRHLRLGERYTRKLRRRLIDIPARSAI